MARGFPAPAEKAHRGTPPLGVGRLAVATGVTGAIAHPNRTAAGPT
ncbi:MAG TPA: hypothetical protein VIH92_14875 [Solirubrobacteraceae bacterium]